MRKSVKRKRKKMVEMKESVRGKWGRAGETCFIIRKRNPFFEKLKG